jgi:hypothetical protein
MEPHADQPCSRPSSSGRSRAANKGPCRPAVGPGAAMAPKNLRLLGSGQQPSHSIRPGIQLDFCNLPTRYVTSD